MIQNAADEAEEEFLVVEKAPNVSIAVTDNDWEFPIDEDDDEVEPIAAAAKYAQVNGESKMAEDDDDD